MAEETVKFTADASELLKENERIRKSNEKLTKDYKKAKEEAREAHKAAKDGAKANANATAQAQRANKEYTMAMSRLKKAVQSGAITQREFNRLKADEVRKLKASRGEIDKSAKSTDMFSKSMTGAVTIGGAAMLGFLTKAIQKNKEFQESTEDSVRALDKLHTKYSIQAGLKGPESKEARERILKVVEENGATVDQGFLASTALASEGFSQEESEGAALDIMLKGLQSSNLGDVDPTDLIQASAQAMNATGQELTAENLGKVLVNMRGLFASKSIQLSDLTEFAKAAPAMTQANISFEDQLAAFALAREQRGAGEGATQLRNVVQNLQGAGASNDKIAVLKSMGMTPADVDLQGETLDQALQRLEKGLGSLSQTDAGIAMQKLVEKSNVGMLGSMIKDRERMKSFVAMQQDRSGFVQGVQTAQSSQQAAINRSDTRNAIRALEDEEATKRIELQKRVLNEQDRVGFQQGGFFADTGRVVTNGLRDLAIGVGFDRDIGINEAGQAEMQELTRSNFNQQQLSQTIGPARQATDRQNGNSEIVEELRKNRQATEEQSRIAQEQLEEMRNVPAGKKNPADNLSKNGQ